MNKTKRIFNRSELYEQAWSKPMTKLAKEYGLSDNGLRKICKRLGVPLPKIGHWVKLEFGKKVVQPPLPPIGNYPENYESTPKDLEPQQKVEVEPEVQQIIDFENLPGNQITVPLRVSKFHPLVERAKQDLNRKPNHKGLLESTRGHLDMGVSPKSLDRALRVFHTIISAVSKRGIQVTVRRETGKRSTLFSVWGEEISIRIYEKILRRNLTEEEIEEKKRKEKYFYDTYEYRPSGKLVLKIYDGEYGYLCKEFADGEKNSLDTKLNAFVVYLFRTALRFRQRRIETIEQHQRREVEWQQREEQKKLIALENFKIDLLLKLAEDWRVATMVKKFVEEVKKKSPSGSELDAWITWASLQADNLDPLSEDFLKKWNCSVRAELV